MFDKFFDQALYRVKKKEIFESSKAINENLNAVVLGVNNIVPLLSDLWVISSYDDNALLLHKSFMESDDTVLLNRCLAALAYLVSPKDKDIIEKLIEEVQKAKEKNKLENIKTNTTESNNSIQENFYTREYSKKRDNLKSKMNIAKLHFYAYLKDCIDFGSLYKELTDKAYNERLVLDFNETVLKNENVVRAMIILSVLLFVAQPTDENIDLLLDNIKIFSPDEYENIYKKIK